MKPYCDHIIIMGQKSDRRGHVLSKEVKIGTVGIFPSKEVAPLRGSLIRGEVASLRGKHAHMA